MTLPQNIEDYLDKMLDALRLDGKTSRRALAEAEDHLRASTEAKLASGMSQSKAEHAAIAAFGYPENIADEFNRSLLPGGSLAPALQLALTGLLVSGAILVAVGLSGALALAFGGLWGHDFVSQPLQASEITTERCAELFELVPGAADCQSAGITHHFDELVGFRLSAGILGVFAIAAYFFIRRRWPVTRSNRLLPVGTAEAMGVAAFAVGVGLLFFFGLTGREFADRDGIGELLSAEIVAGVFLIGYLALLVRKLSLRNKPFRAN